MLLALLLACAVPATAQRVRNFALNPYGPFLPYSADTLRAYAETDADIYFPGQ